jgi:hypothetical protein
MSDVPGTDGVPDSLDLDLCEYVFVSAPSLHDLAPVADAVVALVADGAIRVLDVAALVRPGSGTAVHVGEAHDIPALGRLAEVTVGPARMSQHDLDLAGVMLRPGTAAVLVLLEDRWAGALSAALREVGGRVEGGERIGRDRLRAQLDRADDARPDRTDLLARLPANDGLPTSPLVDPTDQIRTLADLVDHGVLSLEQYEIQRYRVMLDR